MVGCVMGPLRSSSPCATGTIDSRSARWATQPIPFTSASIGDRSLIQPSDLQRNLTSLGNDRTMRRIGDRESSRQILS